MKKQLYFFLLFTFSVNSSWSQLADWKPVSGTDFPTNLVWQINGMTRICQMKFHPVDTTKFYAVTAEGGLFLTTNQGESWTAAAGTENMTGSCASFCVDYTNDQIIWLGTGDPHYYSNGQGIKKSIDGGKTFAATSLTNCLVVEILQNPMNPAEFVAATNKGVYKSSDGGETWVANLSTGIAFCDLMSHAANNSQILFATSLETKPRLFRSTDFGTSWVQITNGIVHASSHITEGGRIAVSPANPDIVYFEVLGGGGIIHKSIDGGLTFNVVKAQGAPYLTFYDDESSSSGQGNYDNCITVDRNDPQKLWLQAHNTWYSENGGISWTMLTHWASIIHTDMHHIQQAPFNTNRLYSCNDGGVWLSMDGGQNWTPKSNGIFAFEIATNAGVCSPVKSDFVSIGTQDNARLFGDKNGWFTISGGDDYARRQIDYNGNIYFEGEERQLNHTGVYTSSGMPTSSWFALAFNRNNRELGFMGYYDVYRSTDLSSDPPNWEKITDFNKNIKAVHNCIADPNRLYVITTNQKIYVSENALDPTPDFTMYSLPFASGAAASIAAMANNPDIVYAVLGSRVYRSEDGAKTWQDVSFNLPSVLHRRIVAEEFGGTEELVIVGTNNAVYYKKSGQDFWTIYTTNLPTRRAPTEFTLFDDGTKNARICYATYGRGMWESGFENLRAFQANILINGDSLISCSNPQIQFEDGSLGVSDSAATYVWSFPGGTPSASNQPNVAVTYPASGTYNIELTVSNNGVVSTKSITKYIQVLSCKPDTIPGGALALDASGAYAVTQAINMGLINTITLSAWIKIKEPQADYSGIIFSANGGATGLNFTYGTQLGYHYGSDPATYNFLGGPLVSLDTWTHVALVCTPTEATIYMDGVPYVNSYPNFQQYFTEPFHLGNDRFYPERTMTGEMDEVCIYNRALSQAEIREQMHLTKNHLVVDSGLVAYYQANELGTKIFDRVGEAHATALSNEIHTVSTAPVGSGTSERMQIVNIGEKQFLAPQTNLNFSAFPVPEGEICVTLLNVHPDSLPRGASATPVSEKYRIIHNYGNNQNLAPLAGMQFEGIGKLSEMDEITPNRFKLYQREAGGYLTSGWVLVDSAVMLSKTNNGITLFSGSSVTAFDKQFVIVQEECDENLHGDLLLQIFPNPNDGNFVLRSTHSGILELYDELGKILTEIEVCEGTNNYISLDFLSKGMYVLKGSLHNQEINRKLIVSE